jgi:molybdopterin-guanine dinucleotide biosynthesis protein A
VAAYEPADVTAAILAGGEGRRVGGADKGLLEFDGEPLIAHVLTAVAPQVGRVVICANRNLDVYARYGPVVSDGVPGYQGPLAGIVAGLRACQTPWLLTVPVDCPEPSSVLAQRLLAAAGANAAAVAHDGESVQPMFAVYRHDVAQAAAAALSRHVAIWRWQEELGARRADFSDQANTFLNLNTPEDFRHGAEDAHG